MTNATLKTRPLPLEWYDDEPFGDFATQIHADDVTPIQERREGREQYRFNRDIRIKAKLVRRWVVITIYKGYVFDGFSLPGLLDRFYQPDKIENQLASAAHDWLYSLDHYGRWVADRAFGYLMKTREFALRHRLPAFWAVRAFGNRGYGRPLDINLGVVEEARRVIFDQAGPGWPEEDSLAFQPAGSAGFKALLPEIMANEGVEVVAPSGDAPAIAAGLDFKRVRAWFDARGLEPPHKHAIERLGFENAAKIYRDAWEQSRAGDMPLELAAAMFDGATDIGAPKMVSHLQKELKGRGFYTGKLNGVPGALTRIAINRAFKAGAVKDIALAITDRRAPNFRAFAPKTRRGRLVRTAGIIAQAGVKVGFKLAF